MSLNELKLPNLRRLIVPDPGFVLVDMDLNRADLQVVAWDSGDETLIGRLMEERADPTKNLHKSNAIELFGRMGKWEYDMAKKVAHAGDYLVSARSLSGQAGISTYDADKYLKRWYAMYPGIPKWHTRIEQEIHRTRMVWNKFGYRYVFFSRLDDMLPTAVAWIPQSSVALVINKALVKIMEELEDVQILLQVHDSLTMQVRVEDLARLLPLIQKTALVPIPYPNPLTIPVGFKISGRSWGEVKDCRFEGDNVEVEVADRWTKFDPTTH